MKKFECWTNLCFMRFQHHNISTWYDHTADTRILSIRISIIKIRRSHDRLIFIMGSIPGRDVFILKRGPDIHSDIWNKNLMRRGHIILDCNIGHFYSIYPWLSFKYVCTMQDKTVSQTSLPWRPAAKYDIIAIKNTYIHSNKYTININHAQK